MHAFTRRDLEILSPPLWTLWQRTDTKQILSVSPGNRITSLKKGRGEDWRVTETGPVEGMRAGGRSCPSRVACEGLGCRCRLG